MNICPDCGIQVKHYVAGREITMKMQGTDRLCEDCYKKWQKEQQKKYKEWKH